MSSRHPCGRSSSLTFRCSPSIYMKIHNYPSFSMDSGSPVARNTSAPPLSPAPPEPRSFRALSAEERISKHPTDAETRPRHPKEGRKGLLARMWPSRPAEPVYLGSQNLARGMEATQRVVRDGVLDPRYKAAATRVTALICATPIMLYLTWELYQRRFQGKERKRRPVIKTKTPEDGE